MKAEQHFVARYDCFGMRVWLASRSRWASWPPRATTTRGAAAHAAFTVDRMVGLGDGFYSCVVGTLSALAHRRLENRAEAQRDDEANEAAVASEAGTVPLEQPAVDLGTVSRQTQRLLHSVAMLSLMFGAGWIWIDVLPALGVLNRIHLWQDADRNVAITLADLAISLVVAVMTVIAARNLPGLLEIAILQRLPIEPASRFAISTVARYLIVVVGLV